MQIVPSLSHTFIYFSPSNKVKRNITKMTPHQVNPVQLFNSKANALLLHRSSICAIYYPPQERRHQVWDTFVVLP